MAKICSGLETELRLGLPGGGGGKEKKRVFSDICEEEGKEEVRKNQVVGWPPVCSYRRKNGCGMKMYVKVSVDGAPFLRKIDLSNYKDYSHLVRALEELFGCFGIG